MMIFAEIRRKTAYLLKRINSCLINKARYYIKLLVYSLIFIYNFISLLNFVSLYI